MSENLKPCPFCEDGAYAENKAAYGMGGFWVVICSGCEAEGPATKTEAEAIAAWNKRAQHAGEAPRRCQQCNAPRKGDACQKCGAATVEPCAGWEEPAMPPVDRIRELAREIGYAIGEHGTKERDLDLIAAPWSEEAAKLNYREVMQHIADGLGARLIEVEGKPLGRRACTIQMDGWYKPIDLSVCPMLTALPTATKHVGKTPKRFMLYCCNYNGLMAEECQNGAWVLYDDVAAPPAAAPQPREWDASATTTAGER